MRRHTLQWGAAVAAMLILSGCTTSTVITDLQVALDAVTVALPVLAGLTGVPADVSTAVTNYVAAANQALGTASTILDGTGTDAEKAAAVAAAFAGIAAPVVPSQYSALASIVQTVARDVAAFLASVPTTQALAASPRPGHVTKWSLDERIRLAHAHSVANDNSIRLAKIRAK